MAGGRIGQEFHGDCGAGGIDLRFATDANGDGSISDDVSASRIAIDDQSGVFVNSENPGAVRKKSFHVLKASFAEVAEPGVVVASLCVVVVGNHDRVDADMAEQVKAVHPMRFHTAFVDLVHRNGVAAQGERLDVEDVDVGSLGDELGEPGTVEDPGLAHDPAARELAHHGRQRGHLIEGIGDDDDHRVR